jgi:hypothetical protein
MVDMEAGEGEDEDDEGEGDDTGSVVGEMSKALKEAELDLTFAWDIETTRRMVTRNGREVAEAIPTLVVARCLAAPHLTVKFENEGCIYAFLVWALGLREDGMGNAGVRQKKRLFLGHYASKFDTRFVRDYAVSSGLNQYLTDDSVMPHSKIFQLCFTTATFRDSYLLLTKPLRDLPAMFELNEKDPEDRKDHMFSLVRQHPELEPLDELGKGEWPYLFDTFDHQDYMGPLPDLEWFDLGTKKPDHAKEIRRWHAEEKARLESSGELWDFRKERYRYCLLDVIILEEALNAWVRIFTEDLKPALGNEGINPLASKTLAGLTMLINRRFFLKEDTIPILRNFGQCNSIITNPYYDVMRAQEEPRIRSCYKGGRTDLRCLNMEIPQEKVDSGEEYLLFLDVNSLYPSVMYRPMPKGEVLFTEYTLTQQPSIDFLMGEHGFIYCEIYYPDTLEPLYHPILHIREKVIDSNRILTPNELWGGKYTFDLRGPRFTVEEIAEWCEETRNNPIQRHNRHLQSGHTLVEVRAALQLGYVLQHVYATDIFAETSCDHFKDYLGTFYEIKTLNYGAPRLNYNDPEQVERFCKRYAWIGCKRIGAAETGEELKAMFTKNPGLKNVGKLMCNSFYGKFGERAHTHVHRAYKKGDQDLWGEDGKTVKDIHITQYDGGDYVDYDKLDERGNGATCVAVAAYITAWARLVLAEAMLKLGRYVLYHDTDSMLIHVTPESKMLLPIRGNFLGEWAEDLEDKNGNKVHGHAYVATAPKSYCVKFWADLSGDKPGGAYADKFAELGVTSHDDFKALTEEEQARRLAVHEGAFRWYKGKLQFEDCKLKQKGVTLTEDNLRVISYDIMKHQALRIADLPDPELEVALALAKPETLAEAKKRQGKGTIESEYARLWRLKQNGEVLVNATMFQWKKDACEFYIFESQKIVKGGVKGQIGGPTGLYVLPWGWERWYPYLDKIDTTWERWYTRLDVLDEIE